MGSDSVAWRGCSHNDAVSATIVAASDGSEAFLARGIPLRSIEATIRLRSRQNCHSCAHDLKLDDLAVEFHSANFLQQEQEVRAIER